MFSVTIWMGMGELGFLGDDLDRIGNFNLSRHRTGYQLPWFYHGNFIAVKLPKKARFFSEASKMLGRAAHVAANSVFKMTFASLSIHASGLPLRLFFPSSKYAYSATKFPKTSYFVDVGSFRFGLFIVTFEPILHF